MPCLCLVCLRLCLCWPSFRLLELRFLFLFFPVLVPHTLRQTLRRALCVLSVRPLAENALNKAPSGRKRRTNSLNSLSLELQQQRQQREQQQQRSISSITNSIPIPASNMSDGIEVEQIVESKPRRVRDTFTHAYRTLFVPVCVCRVCVCVCKKY